MKLLIALFALGYFSTCKEETPKKPEPTQGSYYGDNSYSNYGSSGYSSYDSNGSSSYYDPNSSGSNIYNNGYGTYDQFNQNSGSTFNYGTNQNCDQLYGQNQGTLNSYGSTINGSSTFGSQYSNPLADCSQFNNSGQYSYNYQNPGQYNQQNYLQQQQQYFDRMADNQRNMMLMQLIPNLLGALTGNQNLNNNGLINPQQQQFSNPQLNTPGMGLSGFTGQFGNQQNPYFQNQGLNPQYQQGMYDQFGQYGNQQFNTQNQSNFSNRSFYDDPNFSNGLSGRNSYYQPLQ